MIRPSLHFFFIFYHVFICMVFTQVIFSHRWMGHYILLRQVVIFTIIFVLMMACCLRWVPDDCFVEMTAIFVALIKTIAAIMCYYDCCDGFLEVWWVFFFFKFERRMVPSLFCPFLKELLTLVRDWNAFQAYKHMLFQQLECRSVSCGHTNSFILVAPGSYLYDPCVIRVQLSFADVDTDSNLTFNLWLFHWVFTGSWVFEW